MENAFVYKVGFLTGGVLKYLQLCVYNTTFPPVESNCAWMVWNEIKIWKSNYYQSVFKIIMRYLKKKIYGMYI